LVQSSFSWDINAKGSGIKLSNYNLTANKNGESDYQCVLGTIAINSGKYYWEIRIDKFVDEEDIFVGVARKNIEFHA